MDRLSLLLSAVEFFITDSHSVHGICNETGNHQCRKHGQNNTKCQSLRESLNCTGAKPVQYKCRDQSCDIAVKDGRKRFLETILNGSPYISAQSYLFLDTGVYDNVGIHSHTDGQDDTCDTGKCQSKVKCIQADQIQACVDDQRNAGDKTRNPIYKNHKQNDQRKTDPCSFHTAGDSLFTKLCRNHIGTQLAQLQFQTANTDRGGQVLSLSRILHT